MDSRKNLPIEAIMTAFEASYDGLHILDCQGNTLYINNACTRIEGISREEAMQKNIRQLLEEGAYSESVTLKVLETQEATTIIQTAKNGNQLLTTGTPVFSKDGKIDKIVVNSRDITDLNDLKKELSAKKTELEHLRLEQGMFGAVIAKSTAMQRVLRLALTVAKVDSSVLITGESGVGKGLIAEFIHKNSNRGQGPFIKIDCSSIPASLFESELFGYERGAFTGAQKDGKIGLLEMANGGSVFLDEIGEMPMASQPKLMRAIQDREVMPVGGQKVRPLDVRFISATNVDLMGMIQDKKFREDLYYRLNVVPIHIPPLKERQEDLVPLMKHLLEKINSRYGFKKQMSADVHAALLRYSWPGNVRQLENFIERLVVSAPGDKIQLRDVPQDMLSAASNDKFAFDLDTESYKEILARYDSFIIEQAIKQEGSVPKAAAKLGIDPTTLRRKRERYKCE